MPAIYKRIGLVLILCASVLLGAPSGRAQQDPSKQTAPSPQIAEFNRLAQAGTQARNQGDFPTAVKCFEQGLAIAQALPNEFAVADFLNALGLTCYERGDLDAALRYHQQSLALKEKIHYTRRLGDSLANLGKVYATLGQLDKALDFHLRALALIEKQGSPGEIVFSLNNVGRDYHQLSRYDEAIDYYDRALAMAERVGQSEATALVLTNLGRVYVELDQYEQAEILLTRAAALREKENNPLGVAYSLVTLSYLRLQQEQIGEAIRLMERALALSEKANVPRQVALHLSDLGELQYASGQYGRALDCYNRALSMHVQLGAMATAHILGNRGRAYHRLGQYGNALRDLNRSRALDDQLGLPDEAARVLYNLALVYESQQQFDRAEALLVQVLRNLEVLNERIVDPEETAAFQENYAEVCIAYARLLLHRKQPSAALEIIERGRGQALAMQSIMARIEYTHVFSLKDSGELQSHTQSLAIAERRLTAVLDRAEPIAESDKAAWRLARDHAKGGADQAERRLALLRADLYKRYPQFKRLRGAERRTVSQLKAALADKHPDTLYLEYSPAGENDLFLFALSHQSLRAFTLPLKSKALTAKTEAWRASLTAAETNDLAKQAKARKQEAVLAHELYQLLFSPIEHDGLLRGTKTGGWKHLVVIADGPLLSVPFAALLDNQGKRLIERYALSTALSLSILTWPVSSSRVAEKQLLCAADPRGQDETPLEKPVLMGRLDPLPRMRTLANTVQSLFRGDVPLFGSEASEAEVKARMGKYDLLLFGTHGILVDKSGLNSFLMLAPGGGEDGRLHAREVANLPLTARLAVLAACESGLGQRQSGEGLLGLSWAFRAAGCPSVVASLWKVEDIATERLLTVFFQKLKAGQAKDVALQSAMQSVMRGYRAEPFYWAAFQVFGETAAYTSSVSPEAGSHRPNIGLKIR